MRRLFCLLGVFFVAGAVSVTPRQAFAVDDPWSVGVSLGYFMPATEGWEANYGSRGGWVPNLSAGFALSTRWSVAAEISYFRASSQALAPGGAVSIEEQQLTLMPTTVGFEYRLRFDTTQLFVPFVGAGYRRVSYSLKVSGNDDIRGGANGWVGRGGFDVLLNDLDPSAASGLSEDYGVGRSYFRLEAQWAKAEAPGTAGADIDLGGTTYLAGLRFEF